MLSLLFLTVVNGLNCIDEGVKESPKTVVFTTSYKYHHPAPYPRKNGDTKCPYQEGQTIEMNVCSEIETCMLDGKPCEELLTYKCSTLNVVSNGTPHNRVKCLTMLPEKRYVITMREDCDEFSVNAYPYQPTVYLRG